MFYAQCSLQIPWDQAKYVLLGQDDFVSVHTAFPLAIHLGLYTTIYLQSDKVAA